MVMYIIHSYPKDLYMYIHVYKCMLTLLRIRDLTTGGCKVKVADGSFFQSLDKALCSLRCERQKYEGGTFVGNHVHKLLKVEINKYM